MLEESVIYQSNLLNLVTAHLICSLGNGPGGQYRNTSRGHMRGSEDWNHMLWTMKMSKIPRMKLVQVVQ